MFGATTLHGASWSSYENCPRDARTYFTVVVNRRGPGGLPGGSSFENLGKLWPAAPFSTSIFQSVNSTDVTTNSGLAASALAQSSDTEMLSAVKNGRSSGVQAVDGDALEQHPAAQQVDGEPVDVDRPLDPPRALALRQPADRRARGRPSAC